MNVMGELGDLHTFFQSEESGLTLPLAFLAKFVLRLLSQVSSIRLSSSSEVNSGGHCSWREFWIRSNFSTFSFVKYFAKHSVSLGRCSVKRDSKSCEIISSLEAEKLCNCGKLSLPPS